MAIEGAKQRIEPSINLEIEEALLLEAQTPRADSATRKSRDFPSADPA